MAKNRHFFVIAHNIRSLLNVGSIFRTSDAFGVSKIYLTGYTGTPANPIHAAKIAKVALGAEKFVPWEHGKSAVRIIKSLRLKFPGLKVVALENNMAIRPVPLQKYKPKFPIALLLGEEVKGIGGNLLKQCDQFVEIPMRGKKESLNVAVAFGVAAHEISKYL